MTAQPWSQLRKFCFRFYATFFALWIIPISLEILPGINMLMGYIYQAIDAVSGLFNKWLWHIEPAKLPPNGNGDFPEMWMSVFTFLLLAFVAALVWSIIDRKRSDYQRFEYWVVQMVRYFIIFNGFSYGLVKVFGLQFTFPSLSQLATPLGDFLPMRLSWMFLGYSYPYQFFSGAIELFAALLLLFRPTATLGALVSGGVFINVMMLNLGYDIPVKANSIMLVVFCLYLLAHELPRLIAFFFRQEAWPSQIFIFPFETKKGRRIARIAKWTLVLYVLGINLMMDMNGANKPQVKNSPIKQGIYEVLEHQINGQVVTPDQPDSVYWQNIVFDVSSGGSIKTADTRFRQRYGRSYFHYKLDSTSNTIAFRKAGTDSLPILQFRYQYKDSVYLVLTSYPDSAARKLLLKRRLKGFPLAEKQFHWISEQNR